MIKKITVLIGVSLVCFSCKQKVEKTVDKVNADIFLNAQNYYENHMSLAVLYLDSLAMVSVTDDKAKGYFKQVRKEFKKAEPYASYLKPEVGHRANGPALPILTEDTQKVLAPIGLQKIEESIYDGIDSEEAYARELNLNERSIGCSTELYTTTPDNGATFFHCHTPTINADHKFRNFRIRYSCKSIGIGRN